MSKTLTQEEFIAKALEKRGEEGFDLSSVKYINSSTHVLIRCPEGHEMRITPNNFLRGRGCAICKGLKTSQRCRTTLEEFIAKAKEVHGDKYDYSETIYITTDTPVNIRCKKHNHIFSVRPARHLDPLRLQGCPICSKENIGYNTEIFITKANQVHENKYNYSLVDYKDSLTDVVIICSAHGEFKQKPVNHLRGYGCSECAKLIRDSVSFEEFLERSYLKFGPKYSYSFYKNISSECLMKCPEHGIQVIHPGNHLNTEYGCSFCAKVTQSSVAERSLLEHFIDKGYRVEHRYKPGWVSELDLFFLDYNLAIEYNGKIYHHSSTIGKNFYDKHRKDSVFHLDKYKVCKENGIDLIHIFEFEDLNEWEIRIEKYLKDSSKFEISFKNIEREIDFRSYSLKYYGQSYIHQKDDFNYEEFI